VSDSYATVTKWYGIIMIVLKQVPGTLLKKSNQGLKLIVLPHLPVAGDLKVAYVIIEVTIYEK